MKKHSYGKIRLSASMEHFQRSFEVSAPLHLRQNFTPQAGLFEHADSGCCLPFNKNPHQFLTNPLAADLMDCRSHLHNRIPGSRFDAVTEPCAKPHRAKNSEFVSLKTGEWIADRPHEFRLNVRTAVDVINDTVFDRVVQQSIDREVTPQNVLLRVGEC